MSDVNDDVQSARDDLRASKMSECYYLEYSIHTDVWYRLGGIGMTLFPYALEMLQAARKPNSEAAKHILRLYADVTSAGEIRWRLTKQTTQLEMLDL